MHYIEIDKATNDAIKEASRTPGVYPWKDRPDGSAVIELEDDLCERIEKHLLPEESISQAVLRMMRMIR